LSFSFTYRYEKLTIETEESKQRNLEVIKYINAQADLSSIDFIKSIGYDSQNVEFYLLFAQKFAAIEDETRRESVKQNICIVLKFIAQRKRKWSLIFFNAV